VAGNRCRARLFRYDGIIISMVCSDTACTVRNTDILRYSTGFRGTIDSNGGGKTQAPQGFLGFVGLPEILSLVGRAGFEPATLCLKGILYQS